MLVFEIRHYQTPDGRDVFEHWLDALRDRRAVARIVARVNRLAAGNFGDCKTVGDGVSELRVDCGPGYRVYFARVGSTVVLLLGGGDKSTQRADIERAVDNLRDFRRRSP